MKIIGWITCIVIALAVFGGCMAVMGGSSEDDSSPTPSVPDVAVKQEAAPKAKVNEFPDGDYVVGTDIPSGTYETVGASNSFLDYCDIQTDGSGPGGDEFGQWENGGKNERIIITLTAADGKLSVSGCEPLTKR